MKTMTAVYFALVMMMTPYQGPDLVGFQEYQLTYGGIESPVLPPKEVEIEEPAGNEMGLVPVFLYHRIKESDNAYDISGEDFRKNLEKLHENDFVMMNLEEYLRGEVRIAEGKHPFVLTFDDGDITQFNLLADGTIDPMSAVGILYDFYQSHPDFGFEAAFFLNAGVPFGQEDFLEEKFGFIEEHGLILGNHTYRHLAFDTLSKEGILEAVHRNKTYYEETYGITLRDILALPYGIYPGDFSVMETLAYPSLKVGWKPEVSVFSTDFDPLRINRVQNGQEDFQFEYWLQDLIDHPHKVFTSDGDPGAITLRQGDLEKLRPDLIGDKRIQVIKEVE